MSQWRGSLFFVRMDSNHPQSNNEEKLFIVGAYKYGDSSLRQLFMGNFLGWQGPLYKDGVTTDLQKEAIQYIERVCVHFCNDPVKTFEPVEFDTLVRTKGIDYTGEEVARPLPVCLDEILPGLLDAVVAGQLEAWKTLRSVCCPGSDGRNPYHGHQ